MIRQIFEFKTFQHVNQKLSYCAKQYDKLVRVLRSYLHFTYVFLLCSFAREGIEPRPF